MSQDKKEWWETRKSRSVDNLKLWHDNPRLDPSKRLVTVRDYVGELISDSSDKQNFIILLESIATQGFMSFDPVVVWQDQEKKHFVVIEGNRRVMALKLLRSPENSPKSIRTKVTHLSRKINRDEIEKIKVCIAPSYNDAVWYILQRHSPASSQVRWQRLQQQRFIIHAYDSVNQDIEETINKTGFKRSSIIEALRYVKIRDIATRPEVITYLTPDEKEEVFSHRISMTVLERWFGNSQVRDAWHITFDEDGGVIIQAEKQSFYAAYAGFLKLMLTANNELGYVVNTRTIDSKFQAIFDYLPDVKSEKEVNSNTAAVVLPSASQPEVQPSTSQNGDEIKPSIKVVGLPIIRGKGDSKRRKLTDDYHEIAAKNYKLNALFDELKKLPVKSYPNVAAASIRIFLELAVDEYINSTGLNEEMAKREKKGYHEIILKEKMSMLRGEFISDREANKVIDQLLHASNEFSLNTLNEYIHGSKVHKVDPQFLNRFWDMLSPLFSILISLKEV